MILKRILVFLTFLFVILSFGHAQNYSNKNRWNTKLSLSVNKTNKIYSQRDLLTGFKPRLNVRTECNYGVLNWLELGCYLGFMRHQTEHGPCIAFAPTFGMNVNVHLLPFWVKNKDCRWELYLTAKYGGAYLINYSPTPYDAIHIYPSASRGYDSSFFYAEPNYNHYRHEFGVGIGGGVYFWDVFGIYFETLVGQYSYFPELFNSYYTIRAGVEFKFIPKKKAKKMRNEKIL